MLLCNQWNILRKIRSVEPDNTCCTKINILQAKFEYEFTHKFCRHTHHTHLGQNMCEDILRKVSVILRLYNEVQCHFFVLCFLQLKIMLHKIS